MELRNDITIGKMVRETIARFPDHNAIWYDDTYMTYSELGQCMERIGAWLVSLGMRKGDNVGILASETPISLACFLALTSMGAVPVMLNTSWTEDEIEGRLNDTEVIALFHDGGYKDTDFFELTKKIRCEKLRLICSMEDVRAAMYSDTPKEMAAKYYRMTWEVASFDKDMILFTSGSFGTPKGVVTTHYGRVNNVYAQCEMIGATEDDVIMVAIPMFHCFSMSGNILAALAVGACLCFPKSRKTTHILEALEAAKCTVFTAVPTLYSAVMGNAEFLNYDLTKLRIGLVGGSACSKEFFAEIMEKLHMDLLPSLGQTEATAGITCGRPEESSEDKSGNVGYLVPHLEAKITDINDGKMLDSCNRIDVKKRFGAGTVGELCIRGYSVMKGYYGDDKLTDEVIDDEGFLHTGDIGFMDEGGRITLTGRLKEMIIRGGENIAPLEIENVIALHDGVNLVKVVGKPDAHYGEVVCACIEPKEGRIITEDEIRKLVAEHLAAYKVPKYVKFFDKLPLKENGKIDILLLKESVEGLSEVLKD